MLPTSVRVLAASGVLAAVLTACSVTDGKDVTSTSPSPVVTSPKTTVTASAGSSSPATQHTSSSPAHPSPHPSSGSTSPSGSASRPVPSKPIRTVITESPDGKHFTVQVWAQRDDASCAAHSYGQVKKFLTTHPCISMRRILATTTVDGRAVGMSIIETGFRGTAKNPYGTSGAFHELVVKDGTGSINDLLREGYRLPAGPTSVPDPDAFACLGQDNGVDIFDMWYLKGATPKNAKPLLAMAQEIFLQV